MNTSLRVAGWGTLGFAIAFVVTFAVNATLETIIDDPKLPTAADMAADFRGGEWSSSFCGDRRASH